jgi:hypothetical protein
MPNDREPRPGMDEDMPEADRAMVCFWNEYRLGDKKFARGTTVNNTVKEFEHWLSMIRKSMPAAFDYLCRTDIFAAEIAICKRWVSEPRPPPTPEEIAIVDAKVMEATAGLSFTRRIERGRGACLSAQPA